MDFLNSFKLALLPRFLSHNGFELTVRMEDQVWRARIANESAAYKGCGSSLFDAIVDVMNAYMDENGIDNETYAEVN